MPNRVLKDSINESRGLTSCSFFAQDLYKRLITYADDYGRFNADPQIMLARLYPRELAVVCLDDLNDGLIELAGVNKIVFYTSSARSEVYGAFPNWTEHQRLRESKKKSPDPDDETVNDWYLRRFIPLSMKIEIAERDKFKCQICGKHLWAGTDAKRFVKMGTGLFHIDHEVPVNQGGRATLENLRLTCPECNLSRPKQFSFDEILQFAETRHNSPQLAATRRKLPPESNPIRIQSESNPTPNPNAGAGVCEVTAYATGILPHLTPMQMQEFASYQEDLPDDLIRHALDIAADNTRSWAYVKGILNRYLDEGIKTLADAEAQEAKRREQKRNGVGAAKAPNPALDYKQRQYTDADFGEDFFVDLSKYGEERA